MRSIATRRDFLQGTSFVVFSERIFCLHSAIYIFAYIFSLGLPFTELSLVGTALDVVDYRPSVL